MIKNKDLEKELVQKGYKITRQRKIILDTFARLKKRWITAQELYEIVIEKNPKINFSTVYRNLDILTRISILCKIDKGQGVYYYSLNNKDHHHHLICKLCGKTKSIHFCPLEYIDTENFQDFTIVEHKLEIYGYCKECMKDRLVSSGK
ncbi:MAG: Fur family transcriptional regulator, zinc uptake regulator [Clostridia bacterium]|nr:Fur family transcriptional regulator, zinc uptake regulator [Clostridia bacterium]